jgi:hypothetical protein
MKTVSIKDQKSIKEDAISPYETLALSISEDGIEHLMGTLTNLYSRPVEAVFREYVSNGLDSHLKAKQKKPVEVTISDSGFKTIDGELKRYTGYLKIRDHGVGMTKDDIVNVYSRYASSTKRDSNEQIGAFGLGAKSALAISERFDVSSVKDGVKIDFFIKMNNRGVGVVHFVSEEKTKEENGVTVWVPLGENKHYKDMMDIVQKGQFFKTWKRGTVLFNGTEPDVKDSVYNTDKFLPIFLGEHELAWINFVKPDSTRSYNYSRLPSLSISGIMYNVDAAAARGTNAGLNKLVESSSGKFIQRLKENDISVVLNLPIGSVDLTPSREEIMLTPKTLATLQANYDILAKEIPFTFSSHLNSLDRETAWNFYAHNLVAFGVEDKTRNPRYNWNPTFDKTFNIKYKGQPIPNIISVEGVYNLHSINATVYEDKWRQINEINLFCVNFKTKEPAAPSYTSISRHNYNGRYGHSQIIVYGTKGGDLDSDLNIIKRNARSYAVAKGAENKYVNIYYSRTKPFDNEWLEVLSKPVSIQELETVSKSYRSEQAKIAAAGRKTGEKRPKKIHFGTMLESTGEVVARRFSVEEIQAAKKVIFVTQDEWGGWYGSTGYGTMSAFWSGLTDLDEENLDFTGSSEKDFYYKIVAKAFPETLVIMVPTARSLAPLQKIAPKALTLKSYLEAEITKISKNKEKFQIFKNIIEIQIDFQGNNKIIDSIGESKSLNVIENKITKATFEEFYNRGSIYSMVIMNEFFIGEPSRTTRSNPNYRNSVLGKTIYPHKQSKEATFWHRYNVLTLPERSNSQTMGILLASLVNTVDSVYPR